MSSICLQHLLSLVGMLPVNGFGVVLATTSGFAEFGVVNANIGFARIREDNDYHRDKEKGRPSS